MHLEVGIRDSNCRSLASPPQRAKSGRAGDPGSLGMTNKLKSSKLNYKKREEKRTDGKYKEADQGRTQEKQASRPQENQSGKAEEAPRLRARIEEAQGEKAGTRSGETVRRSPEP